MFRSAFRSLLLPLLAILATQRVHAQRSAHAPEPATPTEGRSDVVETYPVEVVLQAQYGFNKEARPAPGIRVELGITSADEHEPELPLFLDEPVLGSAVSDETGRIETTVAVPAEWKGRNAYMW